ncbi:tetratricopeptide repeat-containing sensor histidine kinase [Gynurincola endophyticus]|uniref:tetratricopeptide repeat-containing sensor histidine kinase n=1 Tax=Gynurincola endophyticus TaxID=2479004 RepID=UPI000F8C9AF2|nr:tetratricopeptide repeat-containing sensor histidine kinase [Gynurincola endophyticus]
MIKIPIFLILLAAVLGFQGCNDFNQVTPPEESVDFGKGESFFNINNDSAFYYFNLVATTSSDSLEIASAYTYMGIIQYGAGDYFGSQESLLQSLKHLNEKKEDHFHCFFSTYNELGRTSERLKNYNAAIDYYDRALKFTNDGDYELIVLSNKAVAFEKKQAYAAAINIYNSIIDRATNSKKRYARILSNLARTKWLENSRYQPLPELWEALNIRREEKDSLGLNASFSHLSDFYARLHADSALIYATRLYGTARQLKSADDELEALKKIISLGSSAVKDEYFDRYLYLSDSIQTERNNAKNQFALIRYDAEKAKADNLVLQKENAEKKVRIIWQQVLLLITILLAAFGFIWYRRKKQQTIREHQLKTSQKVHDVVANGLYRLMAKVEHEQINQKDDLLDEMEVLYEKSRDISYDQMEALRPDYQESVSRLLKSFSSNDTKVWIIGNSKEFWDQLSLKMRTQLEHVLQELMINMKKHSKAKNVKIMFDVKQKGVVIDYNDDGIGMSPDINYGNGLKNTESRITEMNGRIIFDKTPAKGLNIQIYIPIE